MSDQNPDWSSAKITRFCELIAELYVVVEELNRDYGADGRQFTPDGHMVGSIGEVVAKYAFDLKLYGRSKKGLDAETQDGKTVQIKLTAKRGPIGFCDAETIPDYVLVMQLVEGRFHTVYNGSGRSVYASCGPKSGNGQRFIGLAKLKTLQHTETDSLKRVRGYPSPPPTMCR